MCDFTVGVKVVAFLSLLTGVGLGIGSFIIFVWEEQLQNEIRVEVTQQKSNSNISPQFLAKAPSISFPQIPSIPQLTVETSKNNLADDYVLEPLDKRFKRNVQNSQHPLRETSTQDTPIIFRDDPEEYFNPGDIYLDENRLTLETSTLRHGKNFQMQAQPVSSSTRKKVPSYILGRYATTRVKLGSVATTSTNLGHYETTSTTLEATTEIQKSSFQSTGNAQTEMSFLNPSSPKTTSSSSEYFLTRQDVESLKKLLYGTSESTGRPKASTENENEDRIIFVAKEEETTVDTPVILNPLKTSSKPGEEIIFREDTKTEIMKEKSLRIKTNETAIFFRDDSTTEVIGTRSRPESTSEFPIDVRFNFPETEAPSGTTDQTTENGIFEETNSVQKVKLPNWQPSPEHLESEWNDRIQPILFSVTGISAACGILMVLVSSLMLCSSDKSCRKYAPYWIGSHVIIGVLIVICLVVMLAVCDRFNPTMLPSKDQRSKMGIKLLGIIDEAKHVCILFYIVDGSAIGMIVLLVLINLFLTIFCRQMDMYAASKERDRLLMAQAKNNERFY